MINMEKDSNYVSEVLQNRISKVALRSDGVLHIDIVSDELFEGSDYEELMNSAEKIGGGNKFLNLITIGEYTVANKEARESSTSLEGSKYKLADAFVISTFPQKLIANFYMNFHKPVIPTKFFNSKEEALAWLNEFK